MKIILRQDVDELGYEGQEVDVAKGYARNYLIPKGLGLEATDRNKKLFEMQKKKIEVRKLKAREQAEALKDQLEGVTLTIAQKAGEEGKLYGSVTSMDISEALEKKGIVVDRRKILLEKPIKALGEYDVGIKIHPELTAKIKVVVEAQEA
jgi:large subunit ribosomal protein L9